jgi:protein-S-isoprenylcysteine O-methyltransferase Ste14
MRAPFCTFWECRWLGSYLLVLVPMTAVVIWRLFDEEDLLARGLPGYADYKRSVRWRLIPGIF